MADSKNRIKDQLRHLPQSPGVYIMKDAGGTILYIGKASSLKNRVSSYFGSPQKLPPRIRTMVSLVDEYDYYVTFSEQEALILEANLIKQHRPHFNSLLKDDKSFPYLKIDMTEEWPGISVTRRLVDDGSFYFGPFAGARSVRQSLKTLKQIFPFRSCSNSVLRNSTRPCLWYHMGKCLAPCTGEVSRQEYLSMVKRVTLFLNGKQEKVIRELEKKMQDAVKTLEFEKAAFLRDQIKHMQGVIEGQRIATRVRGEQDAVAFLEDGNESYVQVFFIRNSKLVGREGFILQGTEAEEPQQIMTSFVKQFYGSSLYVPPLLLLQYPIDDKEVIEDWLSGRRKGKVRIETPSRGAKRELVEMVAENARQGLEQLKLKRLSSQTTLSEALEEIEDALELPHTPARIEGYDISNIQGKDAVGSMVVFEDGRPKTAHYRRFRIKTVPGADDYAMLKEVLRRRFKRGAAREGETPDDSSWAIIPDLVLIDGGKGQLHAATDVMSEMGVDNIPVASLAKENEELFLPGKAKPVILERSSAGLRLLQRLRDEAHRFAIGYHRNVRKRRMFTSALDAVSGIGPARKRALLRQFGSVRSIQSASVEELSAVKGMNRDLALRVKESLQDAC